MRRSLEKLLHILFEITLFLKALWGSVEVVGGIVLLRTLNNRWHFGGWYVLFHGLVNVFLAVTLFRKKPWAFPAALTLLILFLGGQLVVLSHRPRPFLGLLCILDALMIALVWHEYLHDQGRSGSESS